GGPVTGGGLLGAAQPRLDLSRVVLDERAPLAPPVGAAHQRPLADVEPAEPGAQRHLPREDLEVAHRCSPAIRRRAMRSSLPLSSRGSSASTTSWRGAQARSRLAPTQSR